MARNYLVTGGAGFIGSNYVHRLLQRGDRAVIYDNLSRRGGRANIDWLRREFGETAVQLVIGDVTDADHLTTAARAAAASRGGRTLEASSSACWRSTCSRGARRIPRRCRRRLRPLQTAGRNT